MHTRPTYRGLLRTSYMIEQESLAARAAKQGELIRSVVHRWNVVDAQSGGGFRVFRKQRPDSLDQDFWLRFTLPVLRLIQSTDPDGKGAAMNEGVDRGKLAMALESVGDKREAEKQWKLAQTLLKRKTLDETRQLVAGLIEQEKSGSHLKAERAVLGDVQ